MPRMYALHFVLGIHTREIVMQYKAKSPKPPENRASRFKRLRIAQCRRWSRTLKSIVPVTAAVFIAVYALSFFDVHLGFGGLAAAAGIGSAAGAFLLDRH